MPDLNEGDVAPDFTLPQSGGGTLSLHDLRGRQVVVYFYPKDDTSGCTKEACGFRDTYTPLQQAGVTVIGISPDDVVSHDRFAGKYNLPFPLLADPDHRVAEAYGAWGQKTNYGKTYMGIIRSTFLIDENGRIKKIWRRVKPEGHAEKVAKAAGAQPAVS